MRKITPFLWFNDQAEEAANFYVSVFRNARVVNATGMEKKAYGNREA
jgi:predicted 3-demethylubiquinone-9 3-methyltransferase (glyoxalase superfamily)